MANTWTSPSRRPPSRGELPVIPDYKEFLSLISIFPYLDSLNIFLFIIKNFYICWFSYSSKLRFYLTHIQFPSEYCTFKLYVWVTMDLWLVNKGETNKMQQLVILLVITCSSTCFGASLRPSSGGQTAFSLPMVFCPVVTVVMLESRLESCVHCVE